MEFLKQNKTLVALALAIVLVVLGAVLKVDVGGLLTNVVTIDKQVTTLVADPAPVVAPAPAAPEKPVE